MEFKGTPGPWRLASVTTTMGNDREIVAAVKQTTLSGFTLILADRGPRTPEEADANAHLLAAAPELLETLLVVRDLLKAAGADGRLVFGSSVWGMMNDAIAKALGAEVAS